MLAGASQTMAGAVPDVLTPHPMMVAGVNLAGNLGDQRPIVQVDDDDWVPPTGFRAGRLFANWTDAQIHSCGRIQDRLPEMGVTLSFRRWSQTLFAYGKGKRNKWSYAQACARDDPFVVWSLNNLINAAGPPTIPRYLACTLSRRGVERQPMMYRWWRDRCS